jgi:hypothetical protein
MRCLRCLDSLFAACTAFLVVHLGLWVLLSALRLAATCAALLPAVLTRLEHSSCSSCVHVPIVVWQPMDWFNQERHF